VRKVSIHFPQLLPSRKNRSCSWFVIGEKENRERSPAEKPPRQNTILLKLKYVSKLLIINELLVEAAGVELISVLTTRKLLIQGSATTAKEAPSPGDPRRVYRC
jgi:hypothetical protein